MPPYNVRTLKQNFLCSLYHTCTPHFKSVYQRRAWGQERNGKKEKTALAEGLKNITHRYLIVYHSQFDVLIRRRDAVETPGSLKHGRIGVDGLTGVHGAVVVVNVPQRMKLVSFLICVVTAASIGAVVAAVVLGF